MLESRLKLLSGETGVSMEQKIAEVQDTVRKAQVNYQSPHGDGAVDVRSKLKWISFFLDAVSARQGEGGGTAGSAVSQRRRGGAINPARHEPGRGGAGEGEASE